MHVRLEPSSTTRRFVALATLAASIALHPTSASATTRPPWLRPHAGALARVDIAPWLASDEPEAALVASAASARHDYTADAARPDDVVYEPVGVRVRIVRVVTGEVALVHAAIGRWEAYAPIARLVPEIPPGTHLRIAGGFGGSTEFFATLATSIAIARTIPTGADVIAEGMAAAAYDAQTDDLVRVRVRVISGTFRGSTGYVAVVYTGVPGDAPHPTITERACRCRLTVFNDDR